MTNDTSTPRDGADRPHSARVRVTVSTDGIAGAVLVDADGADPTPDDPDEWAEVAAGVVPFPVSVPADRFDPDTAYDLAADFADLHFYAVIGDPSDVYLTDGASVGADGSTVIHRHYAWAAVRA